MGVVYGISIKLKVMPVEEPLVQNFIWSSRTFGGIQRQKLEHRAALGCVCNRERTRVNKALCMKFRRFDKSVKKNNGTPNVSQVCPRNFLSVTWSSNMTSSQGFQQDKLAQNISPMFACLCIPLLALPGLICPPCPSAGYDAEMRYLDRAPEALRANQFRPTEFHPTNYLCHGKTREYCRLPRRNHQLGPFAHRTENVTEVVLK
jgi:hypothetical protein